MKVVIVGGVAGGATAAARLRRLDESAEIIVLERSGFVSYANCGLPYYLSGVIKSQGALTLQTPESFKNRFAVDVRVRNEAVSVDPVAKAVTVRILDEGREYTETYDKLILSPGAQPIKPGLPGMDNPRILTLRTVEDTLAIRNYMEEYRPRNAVIVGGGFIGLEVAENLLDAGIPVTLLQLMDQVLPPLDYDMACEVHHYLRGKGLDLRLREEVEGFEEGSAGVSVLLKGKKPVPAELMIMAVGVLPETALARQMGLTLGVKGAIVVNEHMETSQPDVYAVGDAVEVRHAVAGVPSHIALAGPANKQGRIAADHICGVPSSFRGSMGSSVIKLFDMTVANTGINERQAKEAGIPYDKVINYSASHATYYPGARNMTIKTVFDPETGRILGAQAVGFAGVDKRIDVLATAIRGGLTAGDLEELDLVYAPPYASAKDPVNMVGYTIENLRMGLVWQHHWHDVEALPRDGSVTLLDVRMGYEYAAGHIPGAVNIPVDDLRGRMGELNPSKPIYVNCHSGLRSYLACRILIQNGFTCYNLSGGFRFYELVAADMAYDEDPTHPCGIKIER